MRIITQALYNDPSKLIDSQVDKLTIEWFQANRRIQRLTTQKGKELGLRIFGKNQLLNHGDVLVDQQGELIVVEVLPTQAIIVCFDTLQDLAVVALEIGNKHMPLFCETNMLLMPYERPMFTWLQNKGYNPLIDQHILVNKLNANVDPTHNKKFTFSMAKTVLSINK